jgi:hypothetical protein
VLEARERRQIVCIAVSVRLGVFFDIGQRYGHADHIRLGIVGFPIGLAPSQLGDVGSMRCQQTGHVTRHFRKVALGDISKIDCGHQGLYFAWSAESIPHCIASLPSPERPAPMSREKVATRAAPMLTGTAQSHLRRPLSPPVLLSVLVEAVDYVATDCLVVLLASRHGRRKRTKCYSLIIPSDLVRDTGAFEIDQSEGRSGRIRTRPAEPTQLGGKRAATPQAILAAEAGVDGNADECTHLGPAIEDAGSSRRQRGVGRLARRAARPALLRSVTLLPGASTIVGLLVAWPAVQMVLGHDVAVLPRLIARRMVGVDRLARLIGIVTPRLAWIERLIRPRWPPPFETAKRLMGIVMLFLGLTMTLPMPFGNVLPALAIMFLALAYLEEDGIAFLIAMIAAFASLAITAATVWGTVETIDWIDPARHG